MIAAPGDSDSEEEEEQPSEESSNLCMLAGMDKKDQVPSDEVNPENLQAVHKNRLLIYYLKL